MSCILNCMTKYSEQRKGPRTRSSAAVQHKDDAPHGSRLEWDRGELQRLRKLRRTEMQEWSWLLPAQGYSLSSLRRELEREQEQGTKTLHKSGIGCCFYCSSPFQRHSAPLGTGEDDEEDLDDDVARHLPCFYTIGGAAVLRKRWQSQRGCETRRHAKKLHNSFCTACAVVVHSSS